MYTCICPKKQLDDIDKTWNSKLMLDQKMVGSQLGTRLAELQMIGTSPNGPITHFGFDSRGLMAV